MDERFLAELEDLVERATKADYDKGFNHGRLHERERLAKFLAETSGPEPAQASEEHPKQQIVEEPPATKSSWQSSPQPTEPSTPPSIEQITGFVSSALRELEEDNHEGVLPDRIVSFLLTNPPDGNGPAIGSRQVRQALRRLTMTGTARRMSRGRYLPARNELLPGTEIGRAHV